MRLINNLDKHYDSLTFIFTMYDQSDKKKLHKQIKSVHKIESKDGKKKTAFTKLLAHMAEYTEESGAVIFDPLKDKVQTYLKLIKKAEAIKKP